MDYASIKVWHTPEGRMRVAVEDRSYLFARPVWAAPLSRPGRYLALVDQEGAEIVMLPELGVLADASRQAVEAELRKRYVQAQIEKIEHVSPEHGATYLTVLTDRGRREVVMQHLQENAIWFSPTHLLLIDVDGNRFEVADTRKLDDTSRRHLREVF